MILTRLAFSAVFGAGHRAAHVVCILSEEDFLKCLRPTYLGEFGLKGRDLRLKGQNRIGNLIVENRNYCEFEDWLNVSPESFAEEGREHRVPPRRVSASRRQLAFLANHLA